MNWDLVVGGVFTLLGAGVGGLISWLITGHGIRDARRQERLGQLKGLYVDVGRVCVGYLIRDNPAMAQDEVNRIVANVDLFAPEPIRATFGAFLRIQREGPNDSEDKLRALKDQYDLLRKQVNADLHPLEHPGLFSSLPDDAARLEALRGLETSGAAGPNQLLPGEGERTEDG